ncbi:unnamed protein product [Caretta caretta]
MPLLVTTAEEKRNACSPSHIIVRKREELKGFNSLDDLLHVKGITTQILELNSQRMICRRRPSSEEAPGGSPSQQGHTAPVPQLFSLLPVEEKRRFHYRMMEGLMVVVR